MTAAVRLCELVPGDQVLDLVAAGTVADVAAIRHNDGRVSDAIRVTFTDGTMLSGPSDWTVVTMREAVDA
ncbi:hypothetical protein JNB63_02010 [Microbacterium trichothecenolyticum]|uniref:hypothetical protein n=1 Tax=Microbacterium trichothecenolyticum TaxID=69370 RepID=UPI001C6DEA46|nr:hypothetical protein [Microbacterium trichothecenolyticum]MBW9118860.1 hypothetical protein [Microbacterium trichothecenolyticum]